MTDEQRDERAAHEQAYRLAAQAVIDMAMDMESESIEQGDWALVPLGMMQSMDMVIDAYRALGGCHSDDAADLMAVTT